MSTTSRPLGIAGLLLATSAWGSLFIVGKPVLAQIDPFWFTLIRYSAAVAVFSLLITWRRPAAWAQLRAQPWRFMALGGMGFGAFSVLVLLGLKHSVPSHGAVVMATMPITTQFVRWLVDGLRPSRAAVVGSVLALAGVVIVSGVLDSSAGASTLAGDVLAWFGTLGWIFYTRGAASLSTLDAIEFSGLTAVAAWPLLLAASLLATWAGVSTAPSADALATWWQSLLYVGLVPTVLAVPAYNFGVRTLGLVAGTAFLNMVPVSAVLMGMALGHTPSTHELIGVALVITALAIHTLAQRAAASGNQPVLPMRHHRGCQPPLAQVNAE